MGHAPRFRITSSCTPQLPRPREKGLGLVLYNLQKNKNKKSRLLGVLHFPPTFNTVVKKTEQPMSTKIIKPVTLCSRIPKNLGCSPGAEQPDSSLRLFTWVMDRTVAATNHGRPMTEHTPSITATMKRSRWYPHPFCGSETRIRAHHGTRARTVWTAQTLLELKSTF